MANVYEIEGVRQKMYSIGELAKEVRRSADAIRRWEEVGVLPPAQYRYKGKRLYTELQVAGLKKLVREHRIKRGREIPQKFKDRARALFA